MMKLTQKEKVLAITFGIFFVSFLMERVVFQPFLNKLNDVNKQIDVSERRLQKVLYIDMQSAEITKSFDDVKVYLELGRTEEDALGVVMKKIEEIAQDSYVALNNMKPQTTKPEKKQTNYLYKKIQLNVEGSQKDILQFLYRLENSNYPLSIVNLDLKVKDRDIGLMEAYMDIVFMYFL